MTSERLAAIRARVEVVRHYAEIALADALTRYEDAAERFYRDTGLMAPGKSEPLAWGGSEAHSAERSSRWEAWLMGDMRRRSSVEVELADDVARLAAEVGRLRGELAETEARAERAEAERNAACGLLESLPTWGAYGWREAADSVRAKLAENAKQIVDLMRERDEMAAAGRTVVECAEEQWRKVESELDEARRLRDLVRHQRGPLHDAELITDEEYAALAADAGAVARLRGYDELRRELAEAGNRYRDRLPAVRAVTEPVALDRPMVMAEAVEPTEVPCRTCRYDTISRTGRHRCRQVFDDGVWRYRCNSLAEMNSTGLPTDRTMRCPGWAPKEPT